MHEMRLLILHDENALRARGDLMITFKQHGDFKNTERFLSRAQKLKVESMLKRYGAEGVAVLAAGTPVASGLTASSWDYNITISKWGYTITWSNSHVNQGANIAILIQYGHGTGTGGYIPPIDYVNPAMRPLFERMTEEIWKEVSSL